VPANPFDDKCSGGQGRPPLREKEDPAFRPLCGRIRSALQKHYGKWRAVIVDVMANTWIAEWLPQELFMLGASFLKIRRVKI